MENLKANLKNLSKNKIYLILIGLAVILLATVLIYAYVEFLSDKISVISTEEGKPYCGAIGSRSEGWYINSDSNRPELIRWDNCDGCYAVCKAIGTRSEGWYVSGNCDSGLNLIKYDNCSITSVECHTDADCQRIVCLQVIGGDKPMCDLKTNQCYCGGVCGDGYCDPIEKKYGSCPKDCGTAPDCRDENYQCTPDPIPCCPGLKSSALFGDPNGDCSEMANCGTICIPCGNGVCDKNEGKCNCPEDCKEVQPICAKEGEKNYFGKPSCCEGLTQISNFAIAESNPIQCIVVPDGSGFCTKCGDGVCKSPENICNCPEDCKEGKCTIGEKKKHTCPDGTQVPWCVCVKEAHGIGTGVGWACIDSPENGCKEDCAKEGEIAGHCCAGLAAKTNATVSSNGECLWMDHQVCLKCGNGICKSPENKCNCPEDCGTAPDCRDENYQCTPDPIPCCPGLKSSALFGDPNGDCSEMANCGTICIPCGNGVCDKNEGKCNCPEDCKEVQPICAKEGEKNYFGKPSCCEGLTQISNFAIAESNPIQCIVVPDGSGFCTKCGDGVCKSPENICNCPKDCKEEETLSADLNCDGNVNLTDAAILLSWWSKDSSDQNSNVNQDGLVIEVTDSPCKNPDINQDGKVNLADFSIMMSQWTK